MRRTMQARANVHTHKQGIELDLFSPTTQHPCGRAYVFIQPAPHLTFVHGDAGVDWLRKRVAKLKVLPSFAATEISEDYDQIKQWVLP